MPSPDAYVPAARPVRRRRLTAMRGIDRRPGLHPGYLAEASSLDPRHYPHIVPFRSAKRVDVLLGTPLSLHGVAGDVFTFTLRDGVIYLNRSGSRTYTVPFPSSDAETERRLVQFNLYDHGEDVLLGSYRHLCLIYPDGLSFDLDAETPIFEPIGDPARSPRLDHACVHVSRLFGTENARIYASGYNDPADWDLDTATDSGAAAAWSATVQANPLSAGGFTALTVYDGHVLAFKKNFCHIINNTQNPFRIADLLSVGASSQSTVAEAGGSLFFADDSRIYRYNGDTVESIGDRLAIPDLRGAMAAAHGDLYYIYVPVLREIFVWSEKARTWGEMGATMTANVIAMTATDKGCYYIGDTRILYLAAGSGSSVFSYTFSPTAEEGEGEVRLGRLYMTLYAPNGAAVRASYVDTSGRETALLSYYGEGRVRHLVSRVATPADRGGQIRLSGSGNVSIYDISVAESGDNI